MSTCPATVVPLNRARQPAGRKAQRTRTRLIDATVALLEARGLRDMSVVEIARAAQTSPATFYGYFRDISEAVLAALEDRGQSTPDLLAAVERDWSTSGGPVAALALIETYCAQWARSSALYRCRNLASDEGDRRFVDARARSVAPLLDALAAQIRRGQSSGRAPAELSPRAVASAIVILLERLAAVAPSYEAAMAEQFAQLKTAAAHMIVCALGASMNETR